jgi:hypothetical protein
VVYSFAVSNPDADKRQRAALDAVDAGWEEEQEPNPDDLDGGWGDDEDEAEAAKEPEEAFEPEPPGLTPEQRAARAEALAARAEARKERSRAAALAKKERRKARAQAVTEKQRAKKKKAPRRERPSMPERRSIEPRDLSAVSVDSVSSSRDQAPVRARAGSSTTIAVMIALVLLATAGIVFWLRK